MSMTQAKINKALSSLIVSIDTLHEDPDNARGHDERNIEAIKSSLFAFGQQKPIVVDENGCVLAGNGTLVAAKMLGWKEIAASQSDIIRDDAKKAYAIADNKTAELATWNFQVLADTLASLQHDSDLLLSTGFSDFEIEPLINAKWEDEAPVDDDDDENDSDEHKKNSVSFSEEEWDFWLAVKDTLDCNEKLSDSKAMTLLFKAWLEEHRP